jgi:hypothetical protein
MKGWVWRLHLGAGALATGVYYLLPAGPQAVLNIVVGDALFSLNELVLGIEPFPSLADALYSPAIRCWPPAWPCWP